MPDHMQIARGSTAPFLLIDLTEGGAPADLSSATLVRLTGRFDGVNTISADLAGRPVDGKLTYQWGPTDLDTEGMWSFEVAVTRGGKVAKHPIFQVEVIASLT